MMIVTNAQSVDVLYKEPVRVLYVGGGFTGDCTSFEHGTDGASEQFPE